MWREGSLSFAETGTHLLQPGESQRLILQLQRMPAGTSHVAVVLRVSWTPRVGDDPPAFAFPVLRFTPPSAAMA